MPLPASGDSRSFWACGCIPSIPAFTFTWPSLCVCLRSPSPLLSLTGSPGVGLRAQPKTGLISSQDPYLYLHDPLSKEGHIRGHSGLGFGPVFWGGHCGTPLPGEKHTPPPQSEGPTATNHPCLLRTKRLPRSWGFQWWKSQSPGQTGTAAQPKISRRAFPRIFLRSCLLQALACFRHIYPNSYSCCIFTLCHV